MTAPVTLERRGRIAVLWIDNPPVNALSEGVRRGLACCVAEAEADPGVERIVLLTRGRTFVSGADIKEFGKPSDAPNVADVIALVADAKKPVVCGVHGAALGGGLELALACSHRLCVAGAQLGLPEVKLGLIPGAGGTQRLPRLVGAAKALEMLVTGEPIGAREALAIGLIDAIVADGGEAVIRYLEASPTIVRRPSLEVPAGAAAVVEQLLASWRRTATERYPGLKAPQSCIDAVAAACTLPLKQGLAREKTLFRELLGGAESKALIHLFFGEREAARVLFVPADVKPLQISRVTVVGAGDHAADLISLLAGGRISVAVFEPDSSRKALMATALQRRGTAHVTTSSAAERLRDQVVLAEDLRVIADADLVVVADSLVDNACRQRIDEVAEHAPSQAILAYVGENPAFADSTRWAGRALCLHAPAGFVGSRALETARGQGASPEVAAAGASIGRLLKMTAITPARAGILLGPRLIGAYLDQALALKAEGVPAERIDGLLQRFGMALGPLAWLRAHGADDGCSHSFDLGSGRGSTESDQVSDREIIERCVLALVNAGAKMLEGGLAMRGRDIDVLWVLGYGFPRRLGGPMFYADTLGLDQVLASLIGYQNRLGEAWAPASLIRELSAGGRSLARFAVPRP